MGEISLPVPWWVEVLQLAKEWSIPPWDIVHDKGKALWIVRKRVYSQTIEGAKRDKAKHNR